MGLLTLVYLLQPLSIILATSLLLFWYYRRRRLTPAVLGLSAFAYFIAIFGKVFLQGILVSAGLTSSNPYVLGTTYGLETSILEVGLAYLVAQDAFTKNRIKAEAAPAYGAGLASGRMVFCWECLCSPAWSGR